MFFSKKLKKFNKIKHCFFSRKGGFSKGIYKGLNCGRGSKDNKNNIIKNLNFASRKLLLKKNKLVLMYQTHSNKVIEVTRRNSNQIVYADAMITKIKGLAIGVVTADCVPILIYDKKNDVIGCIHAGWRGAYSGIIKNTILKIRKINPSNQIFASIGPCIGKNSYEVDYNFSNKFISRSKKIKNISQRKIKIKICLI